jgi:hypothetical protein
VPVFFRSSTGRIGSQIVEYPFAVGRECVGIVEKTGAGVKPGEIFDL